MPHFLVFLREAADFSASIKIGWTGRKRSCIVFQEVNIFKQKGGDELTSDPDITFSFVSIKHFITLKSNKI